MRTALQLATTILLLGAATTHAQITNPDNLIAPTPRNPARSTPQPTNDLQWLWQYTQPAPSGNKSALLQDPRFKTLLHDNLKAPQSMWGTNIPLGETAFTFLQDMVNDLPQTASEIGTVSSTDNRYITITGCSLPFILDGLPYCSEHGILFLDLGERKPLIVFAALRWNEQSRGPQDPQAPYTLWIFPSRRLDVSSLPAPVARAITAFSCTTSCSARIISATIMVDPDGTPHPINLAALGASPAVPTK